MRLGLVARADNSGLGIQTFEFYRHMRPDKTMVVDISNLNGNKQYPERYADNAIGTVNFVTGIPTPNDINEFLKDLDVVFVAEAPYNYFLYERARELGVKTAVQYNYEFFDWFSYQHYPKPDMLIAPSKWHYADVQDWCDKNSVKHVYLHCPVDRDKLPFRKILKARTFLHVAGKSAAHDRNGTNTVIEAGKYLTSQAKILIHFQGEQGLSHQATTSLAEYIQMLGAQKTPKVIIRHNEFENYEDVYAEGDVLLLPRRYGGNCLPMNEALSIGMPVIMTNISPNQGFLPHDWLVEADRIGQFTPRTTIDIYGADPRALAAKIDELYNFTEGRMNVENQRAGRLARSISWQTMERQYRDVFGQLCNT